MTPTQKRCLSTLPALIAIPFFWQYTPALLNYFQTQELSWQQYNQPLLITDTTVLITMLITAAIVLWTLITGPLPHSKYLWSITAAVTIIITATFNYQIIEQTNWQFQELLNIATALTFTGIAISYSLYVPKY